MFLVSSLFVMRQQVVLGRFVRRPTNRRRGRMTQQPRHHAAEKSSIPFRLVYVRRHVPPRRQFGSVNVQQDGTIGLTAVARRHELSARADRAS